MVYAFSFAFGAVIGSFLNVCIGRLPTGESVVSPPSHCPKCGARILSRDNVPLLSYLLLRARCRSCGAHISLRYPAVEVLTGIVFVLLVYRFGLVPIAGVYAAFAATLIVVTFIDLDHQIIPDVISLPGILAGLFLAALGYGPPLVDSALGAVLGGGLLYAVAAGYHGLTGREGMGGGDIKLLAMIGAFLGWRSVLVTVVIASFVGSLVGVALMLGRGADSRIPIPFGPFLAFGALCALFAGGELIDWYLRLTGAY